MKRKLIMVFVSVATFLLGLMAVPPLNEIPPLTDEIAVAETVELRTPPLATPAEKVDSLTIQISRHPGDSDVIGRTVTVTNWSDKITNFDLDLGESIEDQTINLQRPDSDTHEYKIEQQFETSMAIGDEGPHWDFTEWKHHTSPWKPIEKVSDTVFRTQQISETDVSRFPSVTKEEILRLASKEGKRLTELARTCTTPDSGACYVTVSRISLRVSVKKMERWQVIHQINFSVPMGC